MSKESEELELFHYGVKGMRWGVSRAPGSGKASRAERKEKKAKLKALDKASFERDRADKKVSIERAREDIYSGKARAEYKQAKAKYKEERQVIGKREARKTLQKAADEYTKTWLTSQEAKDGKELVQQLLIGAAIDNTVSKRRTS